MKKNYRKQIYEEGLGASLYKPVSDAIKNKSNKNTKKVLTISWKIIYTIIAVLVTIIIFWLTFPLK